MSLERKREQARRRNKLLLLISGRRLRVYSMVLHTGRVSGARYRNPVAAYPLDDGFVLPVLYGRESQWVRNVLATGSFAVRTKGQDHELVDAQVIPASRAVPALPGWVRRNLEKRGTVDFVWGRRGSGGGPAGS